MKLKRAKLKRGNTLVEAALLIPLIILLLVGMVQIARITYVYYTLRKTVYSIARYVGTQQGVNFCDAGDPAITSGINFGLTGTTDASQEIFVNGLTPAMIVVTAERYNTISQSMSVCSCSIDGCDAAQGGGSPDFIVVSVRGYRVPLRIPGISIDPITLGPQVKVPYAGT